MADNKEVDIFRDTYLRYLGKSLNNRNIFFRNYISMLKYRHTLSSKIFHHTHDFIL